MGSKISWHSRKFEDNQWQIRSRIQTPSLFGSSPSITTWLRRPMALISLTVLSTFTLKRRRLILFFLLVFCKFFYMFDIRNRILNWKESETHFTIFEIYIMNFYTVFFGGQNYNYQVEILSTFTKLYLLLEILWKKKMVFIEM